MEILSYVVSGALAHRDSGGGEGVLRPGQWQWMGAGHGIEHSEYNASDVEPVHFLQVWIQPDRVNAKPAHAQRAFDREARRGRWVTYASPDGAAGSLAIRQQAWVRGIGLDPRATATLPLQSSRRYWLQVVEGAIVVGGDTLAGGDALGVHGEQGGLELAGLGDANADVLVFDLPQ
jgi:redox-sensitive bicupin YhaK (pirin superfamily)